MSRLESFGMTELERCGCLVIVYVLLGMMKTWEEVSTTGVEGWETWNIFHCLKSKNIVENATLMKALFLELCKEVHPENKIEMAEPEEEVGWWW